MNKNLILAILLAGVLVLLCLGIYFFRPVPPNITRIAVVGDSQTKISPDTAVITFAVVTQNQQAVTAQQENARKSDAVIKAVQALESNVKPEVRTSDYNLMPEQDYIPQQKMVCENCRSPSMKLTRKSRHNNNDSPFEAKFL
jgi:uncharacterized protein YggE